MAYYTEIENDWGETGFTMIEIVVMLGVITAISILVLTTFTGFNQGALLNRSVHELAISLRKAQNMSLSVALIPEISLIPPRVGVYFSTLPNQAMSYFVFADIDDTNGDTIPDGNGFYNSPPDVIVGQIFILERGIRINALTGFMGGAPNGYTILHTMFAAPEATISLTDSAGTSIGQRMDVELSVPSGSKKTLTIRTSGQINIR